MSDDDLIFDPERVRDVSVAVYKLRLEDASGGGNGAVARMLKKDGDGGKKLRNRARAYDPLTKAYVTVLGVDFPTIKRKGTKADG
jgi:hypothetical protein